MTWADSVLESRQNAVARFIDEEHAKLSTDAHDELMGAACHHSNKFLWSAGLPDEAFARKIGTAETYAAARAAAAALIDDPGEALLPRAACFVGVYRRELFTLAPEEVWAFRDFAVATAVGQRLERDGTPRARARAAIELGIDFEDVERAWSRWSDLRLARDVATKAATIEAGGRRATAERVAELPGGEALTVARATRGLEQIETLREERAVRSLVGAIRALPERFVTNNVGALKQDERALIEGVRLQDRRLSSVAAEFGIEYPRAQQVARGAATKLQRLAAGRDLVDRDLERAIERTVTRSHSLSLRL